MYEYDIAEAFDVIENELIKSMIGNMKRHRLEEKDEGIEWSMWQAEQLKSFEIYKRNNRKKYPEQFRDINGKIDELIRAANQKGGMEQETAILNAIKKGFKGYKKTSSTIQAEFFKINERKLDALIKATISDMEKAETAILRMANDKYRKVIFNAQVYANTGAGTYEKAVDMATKDMLAAGLNCVEYKNGARHTLANYARMAIQTASKRAYLQGEGEKRQEWGINLVIMNKRGNPCPKCLPFVGKILIDDVWSGGSSKDGDYPLMSNAIARGLYHPNCKDSHTTYFKGISTLPDSKWTKEEIENIENIYKQEQKENYAENQINKFKRLEKYSLGQENKKQYKTLKDKLENQKLIPLTESERGAIIRYVSPDSYSINDKLRRGAISEFTDIEKEWKDNIDKALDKLPCYKGNLNRSVTFNNDTEAFEFFECFKEGEEYIPKQYLSTTKKGVYNDGAQVQIYIQNAQNGKDLGDLSIENEVLYKMGSRFKVINKVVYNEKYVILLEEA